ncbi:sulfurtransferase [Jonesia quinghaiensis]|uniref:sulfurtransferase n=1 Tax=Jonesia quinghaiensis TaxID=262806 RepID=UPI000418EEDE|nr:sulfurtransferase [Jonesia quinghaiensis]
MSHAQAPQDSQRSHVFITADDLRTAVETQPTTLRILDVRWQLGNTSGRNDYEEQHIPGALFADLDTQLAAPASPEAGRHPLPSLHALTDSVRCWGITHDHTVVVYDAVGGLSAARAWWLLRWAGITDVRILDGGLPAWVSAGGPVASGNETTTPTDIDLTAGHLPTITMDEAEGFPEHGILLDARAPERYAGTHEPIDPRPGHIPGALNTPTAHFLNSDGQILPSVELIDILADTGVLDPDQAEDDSEGLVATSDQPVAVYCGSGVTASHAIAVLASLGIEAALYPGSWSQWSQDHTRPAETGEHAEP